MESHLLLVYLGQTSGKAEQTMQSIQEQYMFVKTFNKLCWHDNLKHLLFIPLFEHMSPFNKGFCTFSHICHLR